jgi:hypothetical protein
MPKRLRIFIGTVVTVIFVVVYALVAMALAQARLVQDAPALVQALCYMVLGLAWALPMLPLIRWMQRPDTHDALKDGPSSR